MVKPILFLKVGSHSADTKTKLILFIRNCWITISVNTNAMVNLNSKIFDVPSPVQFSEIFGQIIGLRPTQEGNQGNPGFTAEMR